MHKPIIATVLAAAALSFPASAATERASFRLTSTVHTICRVNFGSEASADDGRIAFGMVEQLCNSRTGFRVTLVHPVNMQGASFMMGSRRVPLSAGNETVIIDENHPVFNVAAAELDLGDARQDVPALSFRVEPKGPVY